MFHRQGIAAGNFDTLIYIEDFIKNFNDEELRSIKYDTSYLERNICVYKAEDIPKFQGGQPKGVSKTEYDSDLSALTSMDNSSFIRWVKNICTD